MLCGRMSIFSQFFSVILNPILEDSADADEMRVKQLRALDLFALTHRTALLQSGDTGIPQIRHAWGEVNASKEVQPSAMPNVVLLDYLQAPLSFNSC